MPLPFIIGGAVLAKVALGAAVTAGVIGTAAGVKGAMDSSEAKEVQGRAEDLIEIAKVKIEDQKEKTAESIKELGREKIEVLSNEINVFVKEFSKLKNVALSDSLGVDELRRLNFSNEELKEMKEVSIGAINILSGGAAGVGAGVLMGFGTFGGVSALGMASTGTAIGSLSGVAATNATLAWLGGGSLAAGGGGMALGSAVLGGLIAGPALLVAGGLFCAKSKEKLNNAYSNLAEARKISAEIDLAVVELDNISKTAIQMRVLLNKIREPLADSLILLKSVTLINNDWKKLNSNQKENVANSVKLVQIAKMIIDTPLLDEQGKLTKKSKELIA